MGRAIVTRADVEARQMLEGRAAGEGRADEYLDRLVKYIPADVIAAYLAVEVGLGKVPAGTQQLAASLVVFGIFFFGTYFWLRRLGVHRWSQLAISMLAFAVWAVATSGGPLAFVQGGKAIAEIYGPMAVPIFTFVAALVIPPEAPPSPAPAPAH